MLAPTRTTLELSTLDAVLHTRNLLPELSHLQASILALPLLDDSPNLVCCCTLFVGIFGQLKKPIRQR
jgi:hypothetical protein